MAGEVWLLLKTAFSVRKELIYSDFIRASGWASHKMGPQIEEQRATKTSGTWKLYSPDARAGHVRVRHGWHRGTLRAEAAGAKQIGSHCARDMKGGGSQSRAYIFGILNAVKLRK